MLKSLTYFYRLIILSLAAFLPAQLAYGMARLYGDWRYQRDRVRREMIAQPDVLTDLGLLSSTISFAAGIRSEIEEMSVLQHS